MAPKLPVEIFDVPDEVLEVLKSLGANVERQSIMTKPGDVVLPAVYRDYAERFYNFEFRSDDIVVTTFPKSGTVWAMELVWGLTHLDQIDVPQNERISDRVFMIDSTFIKEVDVTVAKEKFAKQCPDIEPGDDVVMKLAEAAKTPRIIWTHLPLNLLHPDLHKTCKIVYVARNPKDVCVSYYHFAKDTSNYFTGTFENFFELFTFGSVMYGPYWGHIREAMKLKDNPNFHMMFYEDMKTDIMAEARKLSKFLELEIKEDVLQKVADRAHFDNMKERRLGLNMTDYRGNHFRKGEVGDWANYATPEIEEEMNKWIEKNSSDLDITFRYE